MTSSGNQTNTSPGMSIKDDIREHPALSLGQFG